MSGSGNCPVCDLGSRVVAENDHAAAIRDKEPAAQGHTLVIPKRHCASFFDLSEKEVEACFRLLREQRSKLLAEYHPAGFNLGVNDGEAAGQTIAHAHWHLIPRYRGDHPDPRGGVRHVIPTRR
jgi:diadenosine tetraphosphate (Ap4A) HIT family hydrolase